MTIAAHETREDKFRWLNRPFDQALSVSLYAATFGTAAWGYELMSQDAILAGLIGANLVILGLVFWGMRRMAVAAGKS